MNEQYRVSRVPLPFLPAVVLMSALPERCDEAAGLDRSRVHELADHLATDPVTHFSSHPIPVTYIARDFTVYRVRVCRLCFFVLN